MLQMEACQRHVPAQRHTTKLKDMQLTWLQPRCVIRHLSPMVRTNTFLPKKLDCEDLVRMVRSSSADTQTLLIKMQQWHQLWQVRLQC